MSSRSQELASALVKTMGRVRVAQKAAERHVARHKGTNARTVKYHHELLAAIQLAKNDVEVIERMMKAESERAVE
jgi:hypothetical protein